jgi:hypothetical protein
MWFVCCLPVSLRHRRRRRFTSSPASCISVVWLDFLPRFTVLLRRLAGHNAVAVVIYAANLAFYGQLDLHRRRCAG